MSKQDAYLLSNAISAEGIVCAEFVSGIRAKHAGHAHPDAWELICCISGDAEILKGLQGIRLRSNETVLIQPGITHSYITKRKDAFLFSIAFLCSSPILRSFQDRSLAASKTVSMQIQELVSELRNGFLRNADQTYTAPLIPNRDTEFGAEQMIRLYLEQILIGLYRTSTIAPRIDTVRSFPSREAMHTYLTEMVTLYISENLSKHISLEEIAAHFHYSRSRINSIYKSTAGITINKAIAMERIRRAQHLLVKRDKSVAQISEEVGFASPQYFCRRFTKEVGCPPSRYCQMLNEQKVDSQKEKWIYELHLRDPFLLAVDDTYYLYSTRAETCMGKADGFDVYTGKDLMRWSGPFPVFTRPDDFWADRNFWSPEVYAYRGQYYMLASFKAPSRCRGTQILCADSPMGPFLPWSDGPVTPPNWECLHGTLYFEDDTPYMIFNHEWLQTKVGEICAIALTPDLRAAAGEPTVLFRASDPAWSNRNATFFVADGPWMHRTQQGALLLLWCTGSQSGYRVAVSRSESGTLAGPWMHDLDPLIPSNGGHGMIFRSFQGNLMFAFHRPNTSPLERPQILEICETETGLAIK